MALEESIGHVLANDIIATYDIPRFDKSPYDGFAIRSKDSIGASGEHRIKFKVIDHIGAGSVSQRSWATRSGTYYDRCTITKRRRCSGDV